MALHLRVAGACNLECSFCSYPERGRRFRLSELMRRVEASPERLVQVSGGEPLAAPREGLLALLVWLKRRRRLVELQTNGVLAPALPDAFLERLASRVDAFNVNFSAAAPLAERLAGVDRLCALGPPVRLTYVVCSENLGRVAALPDLVARRLPRVGWLQFSLAKGQGRAARVPGLIPRYADAAPALLRALEACGRLGLRAVVDHIPPCRLPGYESAHADAAKVRSGRLGPHAAEKARRPACAGCALPCPGPRVDHPDELL